MRAAALACGAAPAALLLMLAFGTPAAPNALGIAETVPMLSQTTGADEPHLPPDPAPIESLRRGKDGKIQVINPNLEQGALNPPIDPAIKGRHERRTGTGFFVSPHEVLTNDHVVTGCPVVTAQFGKRQDAPLVVALTKNDHEHDLAVLTSSVAATESVIFEGRLERIDTSDLSIIGFPEHGLPMLRPTIVAAVAKPSVIAIDDPMFPFYADIHPGHSGSPLLDEYGTVVGVVTAKIDTVTTFQRTGKVVTNIGFAIPRRTVLAFLKESHVVYHVGTPSQSLTHDERMERFRNSIAQIICWD